ncbi:hypothetical protein BABINDRAFT_38092 [Babjeviella inositovora NRRL Y-12698]|uniref:EF-hand domain-containing protein n=1 Tax=Babjeviella inositovora NRRL Y-12698 TaxID=984486 RepID=A0A1E3QN04_9ASCO|nr:uncharacterized protein BABINDRAFT_38092 [Babjeviella inositovora NRRL Y-12698]ODQ79079.1 hypothetical protein BABINDRAFT_38092 [Babjeviella inositovora NRRL Y-12698]
MTTVTTPITTTLSAAELLADDQKLFESLDIDNTGEITLSEFRKALKTIKHPLCNKPDLIGQIFKSLDTNHDNIIDFADFKKYLQTTESQILAGFDKIDKDNDGRLNKADFVEYLKKTLKINASAASVDLFFRCVDTQNNGYITYEEFREFLLLMPRLNGSRIATAYQFLIEDLDVSSDGDVTLINGFLRGFGFFLAGGLAGVVSRTCTAPFDRIKVFLIARTDLSSTLLHSKKAISSTVTKAHAGEVVSLKKIHSPLVKAAKLIWKQGGIRGFYVGNGLNVVKVFPESAMKFGSFEAAKRFFARIEGVEDTSQLSKLSTYMAGGFGGVVSQAAVYPIDTLKYRVQCSQLDSNVKGNRLLIQIAKEMYREGGLRIYYRGVMAGVGGIFPYAALDLGTFSTVRQWYLEKEAIKQDLPIEEVKLPNHVVLTMGALSGTFGATMVYPINLIRTRLQAQGTYAHPYTYAGFGDAVKQTLMREGYPGLFKGLVPNLAKVAPAVSISYLMYENLKTLFGLDTM